ITSGVPVPESLKERMKRRGSRELAELCGQLELNETLTTVQKERLVSWRNISQGSAGAVAPSPVKAWAFRGGAAVDLSQGARSELKDFGVIVTGAGPNSIAEAVVRRLLGAGATVVMGVSSMSDDRAIGAADLYREWAAPGARMIVVPFAQGVYETTADFLRFGLESCADKMYLAMLPFAAVGRNGMSQDLDEAHELALRVNLVGVTQLVGQAALLLQSQKVNRRIHVVLPLSPNLGNMGGDGVYGETKAALEVLLNKWYSEPALEHNTLLSGARIGWVRGTGLMGGQDLLAPMIEKELGIRTFSVEEMASQILTLLPREAADASASPLMTDLTGGITGYPDWGERVRDLRQKVAEQVISPPGKGPGSSRGNPGVLPLSPPGYRPASPGTLFSPLSGQSLQNAIVVVGFGEVGPYGDESGRWDVELTGAYGHETALHLAIETGRITLNTADGNFKDSKSGEILTETEVVTRFGDLLLKGSGIRLRPSEGYNRDRYPSVQQVTLDRPVVCRVKDESEARLLAREKSDEVFESEQGEWFVRKSSGQKLLLPCERDLHNTVAGMVPDGWDPRFYGLTEVEVTDRDRNTLYMLIATARALMSAGLSIEELHSTISAGRIGNALGSGIGGMERLVRLYVDPALNRDRDPISLQESLGNVGGGHVSQEILGNYGPMISPVAACATAGISVEAAWEKLVLGKADFMVAGAFDDLSFAGSVGFDDMAATIDIDTMLAGGISPSRMSRPHDRRRKGFVESQGGGTVLMMRAEKAIEMGLPIYGVIANAWSFGDGVSQSIPAPGLGMLT
ncbi:hypothetical protein KJ865_06120, partial [Myxococcota bacterium]|nr:hypothetical protein [Myxococcota bacterium]